ncbi:hypothetical protein Acr_01g0000130 [Actinidia rufa]|uniref:Uncharacterized protein n=1 Tax=Actinidia rufa TaxID=165716 RepID=A0A7J0E115_9ERIC|nr:hypothetical protein Acr_01g0000130 [Actinidia rufa]
MSDRRGLVRESLQWEKAAFVDCGVREGRAVIAGKDWMGVEVRESRAFSCPQPQWKLEGGEDRIAVECGDADENRRRYGRQQEGHHRYFADLLRSSCLEDPQ